MIDSKILQELEYRSPLLAKVPSDMFYYTNYYNNLSRSGKISIPKEGYYKYADGDEETNTVDTAHNFSYYMNDIGFRDPYPSVTETNILGFFGCSFTFGIGVPTEDSFYYQLSKYNNQPYLNLGDPSASAKKISLIFAAAANIWPMKDAVITLPTWSRFTYVDKLNNFIAIVASDPPYEGEETENVRTALFKNFSDQFFYSEIKEAITLIVTTAKLHNIKLTLGSWDLETTELVRRSTGLNCIHWAKSDVGRDKIHPGPKSHFEYFNLLKE
jgi:hypothetical protein